MVSPPLKQMSSPHFQLIQTDPSTQDSILIRSLKRIIRPFSKVAARIVTLIDHGILKEGERIPSIRNMSDSLGVSLNTIKKAYMRLEKQYYIESIPQSGFYVNKSPLPQNEVRLYRPERNRSL